MFNFIKAKSAPEGEESPAQPPAPTDESVPVVDKATPAEEPQVEEPVEQEQEQDSILKEIASLKEQLATLSKKDEPAPAEEDPLPEVTVSSFVTDDLKTTLEESFTDDQIKVLDTLLGMAYKKARVDGLRDQAQLIERSFARNTTQQAAIAEFWSENEDLHSLAENEDSLAFMRTVATEIESKNPTYSTRRVLTEMAERVRKAFAIESRAKAIVDSRKGSSNSSFAKPPRKGRPAPQEEPDEQQKQIAELLEFGG